MVRAEDSQSRDSGFESQTWWCLCLLSEKKLHAALVGGCGGPLLTLSPQIPLILSASSSSPETDWRTVHVGNQYITQQVTFRSFEHAKEFDKDPTTMIPHLYLEYTFSPFITPPHSSFSSSLSSSFCSDSSHSSFYSHYHSQFSSSTPPSSHTTTAAYSKQRTHMKYSFRNTNIKKGQEKEREMSLVFQNYGNS